ncbi:sialidase family protein [Rhizobium sp. S152]|uniref:sialidase family protein n=1 Tax=Rhizobium sp. S152 TaxID=3055038 RepID=UPI0025A9395E|nr:sialidase family protein [Rhizobium sp. S152]MDM9627739.1 sialidase family protein [Rhizobium sp. S152]
MAAEKVLVEYAEVYRAKKHFAAWPANYGLWTWGGEALVVFADGRLGSQGDLHARDRSRNFPPRQARSKDGGRSWSVEDFQGCIPGGENLSADEHVVKHLQSGPRLRGRRFKQLMSPIEFLDPESIFLEARTGLGKDARSWFYVSRSRGASWDGPFDFNGLELDGLATRTDIVPVSSDHALFMMTCSKPDGEEGRIVCVETVDGGRSFHAKCWLPYESDSYSIMPSSIQLKDGSIFTVVRRGRGTNENGWLEAFKSDDLGASWHPMGRPVHNTGRGGNPPSLSLLPDGRVVLVYGARIEPYGIRMKLSHDAGESWSEEVIVGIEAPLPDLGYPRSALLRDGSLLIVYYTNQGAERFIASAVVRWPSG